MVSSAIFAGARSSRPPSIMLPKCNVQNSFQGSLVDHGKFEMRSVEEPRGVTMYRGISSGRLSECLTVNMSE